MRFLPKPRVFLAALCLAIEVRTYSKTGGHSEENGFGCQCLGPHSLLRKEQMSRCRGFPFFFFFNATHTHRDVRKPPQNASWSHGCPVTPFITAAYPVPPPPLLLPAVSSPPSPVHPTHLSLSLQQEKWAKCCKVPP